MTNKVLTIAEFEVGKLYKFVGSINLSGNGIDIKANDIVLCVKKEMLNSHIYGNYHICTALFKDEIKVFRLYHPHNITKDYRVYYGWIEL
jgi:hypothetical protein